MSDKKETPYRKLKNKIARLERDLMLVCNNPESVSSQVIISEWKLKKSIEDSVMYGSPNTIKNEQQ